MGSASRNDIIKYRFLSTMNLLKKFGNSMAPGMHVRNETEVPLLVVLSQLSPLHWARVEPGETQHIECGRVWFTVSTQVYDKSMEPTAAGVALRIGAITAVTLLTGAILGVGLVGGMSAVTSVMGVSEEGVLADGRTIVIGTRVLDSEKSLGTLTISME